MIEKAATLEDIEQFDDSVRSFKGKEVQIESKIGAESLFEMHSSRDLELEGSCRIVHHGDISKFAKFHACIIKMNNVGMSTTATNWSESEYDKQDSKQHASRKFYDLPDDGTSKRTFPVKKQLDPEALFSYLENNIIGRNYQFSGPFGVRNVLYCDYTASGRSLQFIENYISNEVLPAYGNTHTTTSVTSLQTTLFRHEARDIIRNAVNASEYDAVIFVGNGATGGIHKLIHAMNPQRPIVFVGPFEHHSNLLPWREISSFVIRIPETSHGLVDTHILEKNLLEYKAYGRQMIGCFSAASNITGTITNVDEISSLLHKHDALALWDYASAAPYLKIDMNPVIFG
ncbi:putative cysteine desulfurase [Nymphon striatum]|nr:putative cysteine desulfurase [Nymphon striatum]